PHDSLSWRVSACSPLLSLLLGVHFMRLLGLTAALLLVGLAPPVRADEAPKTAGKTFQVPYCMTAAQHVLVRAKINGKGPYNFIIDTGAPALFVSTALCKKLG